MYHYVPEHERIQAPASEPARSAFWKRRAPLGDAEFYLSVCGPVMPYVIRQELLALIETMQGAFDAKRNLQKYRPILRELMRQFRCSVPVPRYGSGAYDRKCMHAFEDDRR